MKIQISPEKQDKADAELGREIVTTSKMFRRYLDAQMPYEEVTGAQGRMLGSIVHHYHEGSNIFQKDIEQAFQIRRSTVTVMLQKLEKKGLIYRESVPNDARLKRLVPTEKGILIHDEIRSSIDRVESELTGLLTPEEFEQTIRIMRRLQEHLNMKEETIC